MKKKTKQTFRIENDNWEYLKHIKESEDRSLNYLVNQAIRLFINSYKSVKKSN